MCSVNGIGYCNTFDALPDNPCFTLVLCSLSEYYGVVTIPAGARSIRVVELNASSSYLAVRDTQRHYYLNGHWTVDWPGRHPIAGAIFEYKRPYNRPESLISTGPTNETLVIEVRDRWTRNRLFEPTQYLSQNMFKQSSSFSLS